MNSLKNLLLTALLIILPIQFMAQSYTVSSPDGDIRVEVLAGEYLYYSVFFKNKMVLEPSPVSLRLQGLQARTKPRVINHQTTEVNETITPVWWKRSLVPDHYNKLHLECEGDYALEFRVYDEGMAYRFITGIKGNIKVFNEGVSYRFPENHDILVAITGSYQTSFEQIREWMKVNDMTRESIATLPLLVKREDGIRMVITESDVFDYPGMYLHKKGTHGRPWLEAAFPAYPLETETGGWGNFNKPVTKRAGYIATSDGRRTYPWRILAVTDDDRDLADSDLVFKLARPNRIKDPSWIKPGKVSWEWWNGRNLEGVDFKTGVNDKTYQYYIDFAAAHDLEYVIMDEGWSDQFDLTRPVHGLDVPGLVDYAAEQGVGIILWCVWHTLDKQIEVAMDQFEEWGVAGIKVDFIDRDDQVAMNYFEKIARVAAEHKLLVDYHGCPKPVGLHRTYPNVVNYEGVVGNEYNKGNWSGKFPTPEHNVTIVFTRMFAGPMDYTPGAMRNSTRSSFGFSNLTPMSRGTRCHQLGMYVVYEAGLQMLCDAPTEYEKYPDIMEYLSAVPVQWDESKVLAAQLNDYVVIARKSGDRWFVGGLNDWTARTVEVETGFLPPGNYKATVYHDGINAHKLAEDYNVHELNFSAGDGIIMNMAEGGGFAIVIESR